MLVLAGCGRANDRKALEGTVILDEAPLAEGSIAFRPLPGTSGPTAGGEIAGGRFSISTQGGAFAGTFRVEITAMCKTGKKVKDPMLGVLVDEYEQYVPARYNRESQLTADVQGDGPNQFEFKLNSR